MTCSVDDYYNPAFHFCEPDEGPKKQPESLGSILFGDRIFNSKFDVRLHLYGLSLVSTDCFSQIEMLRENGTCRILCTTNVPPEDAKFINDRIKEDYALNWLIDGLPAADRKSVV